MPQGDKSSYTAKQKRKASHIEKGYKRRGVSSKTAAARAWATVNKQEGGGKKKRAKSTSSRSRKTGGSKKRSSSKTSSRSRSTSRSRSRR